MMERNAANKRSPRRRLTLLVLLVAFVFSVLVISLAIASAIVLALYRLGLMQPLTGSRLPSLLSFLLIISLVVSTLLTAIAGNMSLRPLKKFIDATKEIASGNFDVRVATRGPEEYSRLAASFNDMARELGSIETLRDDFVSTIAHEYKTPVVSIRGFARLLKRGNLSPQEQAEYLDIILAESDRLVQLSGNVLLLSKVNSTSRLADIEPFLLDEQLRRAVLLLEPQLRAKDIALDLDLDAYTIDSSQELLQQVWINLLSNAIKFTPGGGSVSIRLEALSGAARVTVADTGIGMDAEVLRRAFDKFYQGDPSRAAAGNGLGLSLVKRIVDLCGGTVTVQSEVGQGSAFSITLPRRAEPYQA